MRNPWIKLIASAVLSANYLLILWLILHPHTTEEYRDHYLNRKSDCWYSAPTGTPALPPDTIDFSTISPREACRYLRYGWTSSSSRGSEARLTTLTLSVPVKPGVSAIKLEFNQPPTQPEEAEINIAGRRNEAAMHIGSRTLPEVTIPVDADTVHDTQWLFQIEIDDKQAVRGHQVSLRPGVPHLALKTIRYVR